MCSNGLSLPRFSALQIPMRPNALLQWMGFSPSGQLFVHDSLGTLLALKPDMEWAFVCDTKLAAVTGGRSSATTAGSAAPKHDPRDSYWPVGVLMVPAGSVSGASDGEVSVCKPTTLMPALMAVLCKGVSEAPAVSMPRPLTVPLPLRGALLAGPATSLEASVQVGALLIPSANVDCFFLPGHPFLSCSQIMELVRVHRQWLRSFGLHPMTGASISLAAALSAAAATARGDSADPLAEIAAVHVKDVSDDHLDATAIDAALIRGMDAALQDDREQRAVQVCRARGFSSCDGGQAALHGGRLCFSLQL
jgi:hypothetical protein